MGTEVESRVISRSEALAGEAVVTGGAATVPSMAGSYEERPV